MYRYAEGADIDLDKVRAVFPYGNIVDPIEVCVGKAGTYQLSPRYFCSQNTKMTEQSKHQDDRKNTDDSQVVL